MAPACNNGLTALLVIGSIRLLGGHIAIHELERGIIVCGRQGRWDRPFGQRKVSNNIEV
jgi:hypothetical protein